MAQDLAMLDARKRGSPRPRDRQMIVKRCIFHNWSSAAGQLCLCTQTIPYLLLVTAEPRTIWDAEETNVFKTVLQSIPHLQQSSCSAPRAGLCQDSRPGSISTDLEEYITIICIWCFRKGIYGFDTTVWPFVCRSRQSTTGS